MKTKFMPHLLLLLGLFTSQNAEAVEWPDISIPVHEGVAGKKDRAVIISIEEYQFLEGVTNASQNADDWEAFFLQSLGLPKSRVSVIKDEEATANKILKTIKRSTWTLPKNGRLWIVFIGHGITSFEGNVGAILPHNVTESARSMYDDSLSLEEIGIALQKVQSQSIVVLDCSFNGKDRSNRVLSPDIPPQQGLIPSLGEEVTTIHAAEENETARLLPDNQRPALSYLLLGALRGWSDEDQNGWMSLQEATSYADSILPEQTIGIYGPQRRQKISKALEGGPSLVRERELPEEIDPLEYIPTGMIQDDKPLDSLMLELEQQRAFEVEVEEIFNQKSSEIRQRATEHWKQVQTFAQERTDDPARVAVYAFLREYENVTVDVKGRTYSVEIPEISQARKLLMRLSTPTVLGTEFAWVNSGSFSRSKEAGVENASEHSVRITRSFYISKTEVTQKLYSTIMAANPSENIGDSLPVTNVSWHDAIKFANALSTHQGYEECYRVEVDRVLAPIGVDCTGYRLPTEAEWEFAARGGESTRYSGGNDISTLGWTEENSGGELQLVGQKKPNAYGLYDMSGNVWEWTWDTYGAYDTGEVIDPMGPAYGEYRVRRGGSVDNSERTAQVTHRVRVYPNYRSHSQGIRLVRTAPEP